MKEDRGYIRRFVPCALAAALVSLVGGFSAVLGPAFVRDMGIAYNNTVWTALAQAVASAALAPVLGRLCDLMGRRRTLLTGLAVFTLGNALAALATSLRMMLAARFVVGMGMAAVAPAVMACIVTEFPRDRVARGFSAYMVISSAAVIVGPALGALIIRAWGWRTMVWVCVAVCAAGYVPCALLSGGQPAQRGDKGRFDGAGAALTPVFFGLLLCLPSVGQNLGWGSSAFRWALAAAGAALAALVLAERRAACPILPGRFIRRRAFLLSVLALTLTQGLMQANMTNAVVFMEYVQPGNGAVSGYAVSVMYLGMALGAMLLGPPADRHEPRTVLTASLMVTGAGCGLLLLAGRSSGLLMAALALVGFGLGGNGAIFMKVALSDLRGQDAGAAAGTYGLFRDLAAPFGVAVLVPLFTNRITAGMAQGLAAEAAAVQAMRLVAVTEILSVAAGILTVRMLPGIHRERRRFDATER